ncbi:U2 small nuclear ribonucleoprotein B'' [Strongyloides ratti]|uniref:U2 small nuclear ribonucleoprotein B n=1 Tax=Strongyloides ratti TaxID=34506 RepID=A0A090MRN8_STRRB|nr:U2 small nuclear ribonucleoprotein B'' [Strongyloides ratti]CEF60903.1 U2 small nuclear ribonucleoprotein B'' [Strongyloides ratti]
MADIAPNHTLYINNLNEKLKKEKLKEALFAIFTQFGDIIDILAFRNIRMKGQAHIIFKDVSSATRALRAMQGFPFFDKPMRIQYARCDSDVIAKAKGTYVKREKKPFIPLPKKRKPQNASGISSEGGAVNNSNVPHKILFCTNLPEETTSDLLASVFSQFSGLKEIRMVPNRTDIAFVEYNTEEEATTAKKALHNFKITATHAMKVEYANK